MFSKEKLSIFLYKSFLKFLAKPHEAIEANLPARIPHVIETMAMPKIAKI